MDSWVVTVRRKRRRYEPFLLAPTCRRLNRTLCTYMCVLLALFATCQVPVKGKGGKKGKAPAPTPVKPGMRRVRDTMLWAPIPCCHWRGCPLMSTGHLVTPPSHLMTLSWGSGFDGIRIDCCALDCENETGGYGHARPLPPCRGVSPPFTFLVVLWGAGWLLENAFASTLSRRVTPPPSPALWCHAVFVLTRQGQGRVPCSTQRLNGRQGGQGLCHPHTHQGWKGQARGRLTRSRCGSRCGTRQWEEEPQGTQHPKW